MNLFPSQVILTSPDGSQFVSSVTSNPSNPSDTTIYPVTTGEAFEFAFDRIDISRITQRDFNDDRFLGELYLPSIELLNTGTYYDLNYGISAGTWFNIDPEVAGVIENNNLGIDEAIMGAYIHGFR